MPIFRRCILPVLAASAFALSSVAVNAESISGALAKAYENNSSLNVERAGVRVTDEGVAVSKSGMRPRISATGSLQARHTGGADIRTGQFGISLEQPIFDGFQTRNDVRASEAEVRAAVASLRNEELNILLDAASAYMDVIRDRQIAVLREQNLEFLEEQVRSARSRLEVGEGTRTDVAQAEARRQEALAQLALARAQADASEATYRQLVGDEPGNLEMPSPLSQLLPPSLDQALAIGLSEHPAIESAEHQVDVAAFDVKVEEGSFLPQVSATAGLSSSYSDSTPGQIEDGTTNSASVGLSLNIPIYEGGLSSALVRQSKERLGQARINVDVLHDQVRQAVTAAWAEYQASVQSVAANREMVDAAQLALEGVIEERNVGQRTTLDVLDAQADVITAQIDLVTSQRNVVVASYAIVSAMGRLSPARLGLNVATYQPEEHYRAVKDKWFGLRTPDGR